MNAKTTAKSAAAFKNSGPGYGQVGASRTRKSMLTWGAVAGSPDDDITMNLPLLRARCRDLFMNAPVAASAIKVFCANVTGSGLMAHSHIDHEFLGMTAEQAAKWEQDTEREWRMYAESAACDAQRSRNFYDLQNLVLKSALISGDCFVALPYVKTPGSPYDLRVYVIEGDRICNPGLGFGFNADVLEGVEVDDFGAPVAYYIAKYHPNALYLAKGGQEWQRVPVFGEKSGRRNILHIMTAERPGQRRGVPIFAPVIEPMKQIERYTATELTAAIVSSCFTVFITHEDAASGIEGALNGLGDPDLPSFEDQLDGVKMDAGNIVNLPSGAKIEIADAKRPNSNFDGFMQSITKFIGAGMGLPYEMLVHNYTASYSASRAAQLDAGKMFRSMRQWFVDGFCQPVFEAWLAEAVSSGRIKAPGFFTDPAIRRAWCLTDWSGDCPGQLDPLKEVNAAILRVDHNLSTIEHEAAEINGLAPAQIFPTRSQEIQKLKEYGIDPGAEAPAPAPTDEDQDNDA